MTCPTAIATRTEQRSGRHPTGRAAAEAVRVRLAAEAATARSAEQAAWSGNPGPMLALLARLMGEMGYPVDADRLALGPRLYVGPGAWPRGPVADGVLGLSRLDTGVWVRDAGDGASLAHELAHWLDGTSTEAFNLDFRRPYADRAAEDMARRIAAEWYSRTLA